MGDSGQAPAVAAAFPNPPPYHTHFTKENLKRLSDARKSGDAGDSLNPQALSEELRYLLPPEPPADGKYKSFGVHHDLNKPDISLEEAGITQIYPSATVSIDPTGKLLALSRAIILNFLELVGIMSNNPEEAAEKIEDLQTLFYNAHDLINQYRPHQARESLIMMMEAQLERSKTEIAAVEDGKNKVQELLKSIQDAAQAQQELKTTASVSQAVSASTDSATNGEVQVLDQETLKRRAKQRAQWAALDEELG